MALKFIRAEAIDRFSCLIVGMAGVGKTSLLKTIPKGEQCCTISAESGLLSVNDMLQEGEISGVEIGSFADFKDVYDQLATNREWIDSYRWVFIDSLTEIGILCAEKCLDDYKSSSDTYKAWNAYDKAMGGLIKKFRDLKHYNVVFTCLDSVETDVDKKRYLTVDLPGRQVKARVASWFDGVFYMTVESEEGTKGEKAKRVLYTQPYMTFPAKDRSGKLDRREVPDLAVIQNKILGERKQ
jgi:hypothetical protein